MASKRKQRQLAEQRAARLRQFKRLSVLALLILVIGSAAYTGSQWLLEPGTLPVQRIAVTGDLHHLQQKDLQPLLDDARQRGFFEIDLDAMRSDVEALPWVDTASVRRLWPDRLLIEVTEQVPLARWGKDALVNRRGELFRPDQESFPAGLPHLNGPSGMEAVVARNYREINQRLASLDLEIDKLELNARRSWALVTKSGILFQIGGGQVEQRLSRFIDHFQQLEKAGQARLLRVDLRYSNGFAIRWHEKAPETGGERGV